MLFIFLSIVRGIETHFVLNENLNIMSCELCKLINLLLFHLIAGWCPLLSSLVLCTFTIFSWTYLRLFCDFMLWPSCCFYCYEVICSKQTNISCSKTLPANFVAFKADAIKHFLNRGIPFSFSNHFTATSGSNSKDYILAYWVASWFYS